MNAPKHTIDWPRVLMRSCRQIETAESPPSLTALAREAGVSASELQRQFTRRLGVSPKAYAQALQLHRLAREATQTDRVIDAVYASGFESATAAYTQSKRALGIAPGAVRKKISIGWWMGLSDLGWMLMAATDKGICWLSFGQQPGAMLEELRGAFPRAALGNDEARLRGWFDTVRDFILLPREALDLPVDIQGTAFQAAVWKTLQKIPLGETVAYKALAQRIGKPKAARAVAAACAHNRVALLIPCHRVVASDGKLAGYRWGMHRKQELLQRESKA